MKEIVLCIDFNNVVFSSWYGNPIYNSKSMNTNAIRGFFFRLKKLRDIFNWNYIVICSDISRDKTFRRKLYPEYKNNRQPTPSDVINQMTICKSLLSLIGYPILNHDGYEADDVIGMISRFAMDNNMECIIASSDKDYYQLLNENVTIFNNRQNYIDEEYVYEQYGLFPNQMIDLKSLVGDKSDNIPGVYGIGNNIAIELLQKYQTLDNIYNNLSDIRSSIKSKLENGYESAMLSKQLGTIVTDYTIMNLNKESLYRKNIISLDDLYRLLKDLELYNLINVFKYSLIPCEIKTFQ